MNQIWSSPANDDDFDQLGQKTGWLISARFFIDSLNAKSSDAKACMIKASLLAMLTLTVYITVQ